MNISTRFCLILVTVVACLASNVSIGAQEPGSDSESKATDEPKTSAAPPRIHLWPVILVDGMTGTPLQGITIEGYGSKEGVKGLQPMTFTSDAEGRIEVPLVEGSGMLLRARSAGRWSRSFPALGASLTPGADKDNPPVPDPAKPHRMVLWPGTRVVGRLQLPDGTPASGIALNVGVYLNNQVWKKRLGMDLTHYSFDHGDWPNWKVQIVTAADGTFETTVPPSDARSWVRIGTTGLGYGAIDPAKLRADGASKGLVRFSPFEFELKAPQKLPPDKTERLDFGTLKLERGIVLSGRVLDANGQPLKGVSLRTSGKHGPYAGRSVVSGEDGHFKFLPMKPGRFTLSPDARLRNDKGEVNSRDVQAAFVDQEVTLPESSDTHEITVRALPHVTLEFEWIDRRTKKGPVSYYGEFTIIGRVPNEGVLWKGWAGHTEKIERDGQELLIMKVPTSLTEVKLHLPADQVVTASYEDDTTKSGPGQIELGDLTVRRRRIIYGDDPK